MSFQVIVDSCCDLTMEMREDRRYTSVPLTVYVGDQEFRDEMGLDTRALVDAMASCQQASHTACPSPADYLSAFESSEGDLYVITLSALLSGSHNSAWQAVQLFREEHPQRNVHVFNSCSASSGETLIARKITQLAGQGLPFEQVVQETDRYIAGLETMFVLENLDNLRKAGRLTKVQSLITGALRVKLVMGATPEGEIKKHGQALSIKQALAKLVELAASDEGHRGKTVCITHCLCPERASYLASLMARQCSFAEVLITETRGLSSYYANNGGIIVAY